MNQNNLTFVALVVLSLLGLTVTQSLAAVITVDDDGPADFASIQAAINSVMISGIIEVQPGTYYENISYYGKTIVLTSTDPNDPNVVDTTVIDGNSLGNVVTLNNGEDENCVIAGFTIRNGATTGIYSPLSEPLVRNCVVKSNQVGIEGAGNIIKTLVMDNSSLGIDYCDGDITDCNIVANLHGLDHCGGMVTNCNISGNDRYGLIRGDGIVTDCNISGNGYDGLYACTGEVRNCLVVKNGWSGFSSGSGKVLDCIISENGSHGCSGTFSDVQDCLISANGGDGCSGAFSDMQNCLISANGGDGISGSGNISNCTIVGNGGDGITDSWGSTVVVSNTIIGQNNGYGLLRSHGNSSITSNYNNVWHNLADDYSGVSPGTDDISANPFFAVAGYWDMSDNWVEGEYHLLSSAGRWDVAGETWVADDYNSPCIDAGDLHASFSAELSPHGCRVNMGVYGNTEQASKSPVVTLACCESLECAGQTSGDATCDGNVNLADLFALKAHFGKGAPWTGNECCTDFSHDGSVNLEDLFTLKAGFGTSDYSPSTGNQNCAP
jgi:hypothetical protein